MDESWGHCTKWNKPVTEGQVLDDSNSEEVSKVVRLREAESRMAEGNGEMFSGYKVMQNAKALELCCTTLCL